MADTVLCPLAFSQGPRDLAVESGTEMLPCVSGVGCCVVYRAYIGGTKVGCLYGKLIGKLGRSGVLDSVYSRVYMWAALAVRAR